MNLGDSTLPPTCIINFAYYALNKENLSSKIYRFLNFETNFHFVVLNYPNLNHSL